MTIKYPWGNLDVTVTYNDVIAYLMSPTETDKGTAHFYMEKVLKNLCDFIDWEKLEEDQDFYYFMYTRYQINDKDLDRIEMEVYMRMCASCPRSKFCHEECETCENFDKELEYAITTQR